VTRAPRLAWLLFPLVACGSVEPEALFEPGEHDVGYQRIEVTYTTVGQQDDRVIPVDVWYPAARDGEARATYEVAGIVSIESEAAWDAPTPDVSGAAPLAVYSHGSGGQGLLGYPYGEHLASHGWVVVAPDHVGNTSIDATAGTSDDFVRIALNRPLDIRATLDRAQAGLLDGMQVDADNALLVGHSFGGYTTLSLGGMVQDVDALLATCQGAEEDDPDCLELANADVEAAFRAGFADDRVVALVPQAPALVSTAVPDSLADIDVPVLLQSGERDQSTTHAEQAVPLWEGLNGEQDVWVNVPDGGHYTFVTICDDLEPGLLNLFISGIDEDGCGESFLPVSEAVPRLTATLHAFGNAHVLGEKGWDEALVDGGVEVWGAGLEIRAKAE